MKNANAVNKELTYEKLKTYKGFENITEAEAEQQIQIIKQLAKLMYCVYIEEQKNSNNENTTSHEIRP